ncbi:hypothetical protein FACS1894133_4030 [Clostridia bacterium]|nr:hypothetical protein FACS1894133_4030 [Clostridia bacterium]
MNKLVWSALWRVIVGSVVWGFSGVLTWIFNVSGILSSLTVIPLTLSWCATAVLGISLGVVVHKTVAGNAARNRSPELLTRPAIMLELKNYAVKTPFEPIGSRLLKQSQRFAVRKSELLKIIQGRFGTGLTRDKFAGAVAGVEGLLTENSRRVLSCFRSFDAREYSYADGRLRELDRKSMTDSIKQTVRDTAQSFVKELGTSLNSVGVKGFGTGGDVSDSSGVIVDAETEEHRALREKHGIMQGYIDEADSFISDNEKIILQLDRLYLEISKLDKTNSIENSAAMEELDCLIDNTKLYRD